MVATIHRDPYRLLIRKIGYSVGLEHTLERVRDLADLYAGEGSVTSSNISELLRTKWGLKTNNILDFFNELDLVRSEANTIFVLPTLDALAILRRELTETDFELALRAVLLCSMLSSDGDIFLNCLSAHFDRDAVRARLISMVELKRARVKAVIRTPQAARKIDRFIAIETQKTNKGGAVAGQGINALHRREMLEIKRGPLAAESSMPAAVSDDYLRKVPGRRRDWAITLGLIDDEGSLTGSGERLMALFARLEQEGTGTFTFWPYPDELRQLNLKDSDVLWVTPDRESIIYGLKEVMTSEAFGAALCPHEATVEWLIAIFASYRALNPARSMVRVELPLRVARLVALGFSCANSPKDYDVLATVMEAQSRDQTIELRPSRQHEGSIVFRSR
ncbi:hypothetical protein [Pseudothauera rhizosphaerae]|uniref:Uncharacterized protein n=1 Tax=Pseudothauera rhizosphaerae TaxID=2565932 RepID=A0A4S4AMU5_9RHOO|nr:hypothetical protein [Pseudothauera rhizosphaerae]THF60383.1 hypothetical protein E6O51_14370 [Pseudothauera rhizosphaerae]